MKKFLVAGVAAVLMSGCVVSVDGRDGDSWRADHEKVEEQNRRKLTQLDPGMTVSQVRELFGTPEFNESYQQNGSQVQVLFYRTNHKKSDGKTTKDECTPIILRDGKLIGWGETAYQQI